MDRRKKYGYYHGRFQPFHNGHFKMVKEMLKNHDVVIVGLSNPFRVPAVTNDAALIDALKSEDTRNPAKNPWPYWQRVLMIRWSLEEEGIDTGRVIIVPNLIASGLRVEEVEFPEEELVIYTMPSGKHNKLIMERDQEDGLEVVVFDPATRTISGTEMRRMLKESDSEWEKYVPKGTAKVIKKYGNGTYYGAEEVK